MRGVFLWLMSCFCLVSTALAGPIEDGHSQFIEGDLAGATQVWEQALTEETGTAALHYNLGVAWYRQGDTARAIAHWRMGRVLSPRDANLVHNLAVARSELADVIEPIDTQPPLLQVATVAEWGFAGSFLLLLASLGLWVSPLRNRWGPWPALGIGFTGLVLVTVSVTGADRLEQHPGAVVRQEGAFMRKLATQQSEVLSRLPAGTELEVEKIHENFVLIRTSGKNRGWIPMDSVFFVGLGWNQPPMN